MHPSLRWSKRSPWLESEVLRLDERLEILEKQRQNKKKAPKKGDKVLISSSSPLVPVTVTKSYGILGASASEANSESIQRNGKRRRSSGQRRVSSSCGAHVQAATKQKIARPSLVNSLLPHAENYDAPIGCRWSQNSCAYDSVFTPIFALWCNNRVSWARDIGSMGNAVSDLLLEGFSLYERGDTSLEDVRDDARRLIACSPNGTAFGYYTSIENVFTHLLRTNAVVSERYYVCHNGHHVFHSNDYDAFLSAGLHEYESIVQWVSTETNHALTQCEVCGLPANVKLRFRNCPPLIAFSFPQMRISIDNTFEITIENSGYRYTIAAVIYYANQHFTAKIITRDGRIWFYNGMELIDPNVPPILEHVGFMHTQRNLYTSRGGEACAVIYARI